LGHKAYSFLAIDIKFVKFSDCYSGNLLVTYFIFFIIILLVTLFVCLIAISITLLWSKSKCRKNKYIFISHHQTEGQDHDMKVANMSFENVAEVKWLGTKVTKFAFIKKFRGAYIWGIPAIIQFRIICLLLCYLEMYELYKIIICILPGVLYGCETWFLTLRE
jgi:hypothetical protein